MAARFRDAALDNPHEFATVAVAVIEAKLADQLVDGIKYEKIDEWYDQTLFDQDEIVDAWKDYMSRAKRSAVPAARIF